MTDDTRPDAAPDRATSPVPDPVSDPDSDTVSGAVSGAVSAVEADDAPTLDEANPVDARPESGPRASVTIEAQHRRFLRPEPVGASKRIATRARVSTVGWRLFVLTASAMVMLGIVAGVGVWSLGRSRQVTRDQATWYDARRINDRATAELRSMAEAPDVDVPAAGREIAKISAQFDSRVVDPDIRALNGEALDATDAYQRARTAGRGRVSEGAAYRAAIAAFRAIDVAVDERQAQASAQGSRVWKRSAVLLAALLAATSLVLVALGRLISLSILQPLRLLGRSMRRFGDGDLYARASEAPDEIGTLARSFNAMADSIGERVRTLNDVAERGTQLRMISDAMDLADREPEVFRILDRAFGILTPDLPGELLLTELTSTRLGPVSANPSAGAAGCPVENAEGCVAMRRGQPVVFDSPAAINACPQLRNHAAPCSAACVPVSVNGQLLGVMHVTAPEYRPPDGAIVDQLVMLSGQLGSRISAMRTLETSRLEASTDGLTGLANRRMLESRLGDLVRGRLPFALAVADLDHFKALNDNYGHEVGDRALQVFSTVLHDNVRGHDLVARFGGEEFVLVFPELSVPKSMEVLERIRAALVGAIAANGLPDFTASFGVTASTAADSVEGIIRIADAGLLLAKEHGRNRVVFADHDTARTVFGSARSDARSATLVSPPRPSAADPLS